LVRYENEQEEYYSEFGEGLTYCLGLFLAHEGKYYMDKENFKDSKYMTRPNFVEKMFFSGAGDHVGGTDTSTVYNTRLKKRIEVFKSKIYKWHNWDGKPNEKSVIWAIKEAKDLLAEIDKVCLGVNVSKGYE
jgi:hypothetical protein